jgi:hypothetical protein
MSPSFHRVHFEEFAHFNVSRDAHDCPTTPHEPYRLDGTSIQGYKFTSISASLVDEHVARASVSIPPKKHKGSPPRFSNTAVGSRHVITTTEDDNTVAMKTQKAMDSQRKPRLFVKLG